MDKGSHVARQRALLFECVHFSLHMLHVYACPFLCTMRLLVGNHLSFRLNWSQLTLEELMQHDS